MAWLRGKDRNFIAAAISLLALLIILAAGPAISRDGTKRLFGSIEFIGGSLKALPQWVDVLRKIEDERKVYRACNGDITKCPSPAVAAWQAKIRSVEGLPKRRQMEELNRFINSWTYRVDAENYNVEDFWATPLQFLRRSGDCEDYAIIKYVSLRALGFSADELRIVVVRDVLRNIAHAVLAVYLDNDIFIMDSLFDGVLSHHQVTFYSPQYSVNEHRRWAHIVPIARRPSSGKGVIAP